MRVTLKQNFIFLQLKLKEFLGKVAASGCVWLRVGVTECDINSTHRSLTRAPRSTEQGTLETELGVLYLGVGVGSPGAEPEIRIWGQVAFEGSVIQESCGWQDNGPQRYAGDQQAHEKILNLANY